MDEVMASAGLRNAYRVYYNLNNSWVTCRTPGDIAKVMGELEAEEYRAHIVVTTVLLRDEEWDSLERPTISKVGKG